MCVHVRCVRPKTCISIIVINCTDGHPVFYCVRIVCRGAYAQKRVHLICSFATNCRSLCVIIGDAECSRNFCKLFQMSTRCAYVYSILALHNESEITQQKTTQGPRHNNSTRATLITGRAHSRNISDLSLSLSL